MSATTKTKAGTMQMNGAKATPITNQRGQAIQKANTVVPMAIGVSDAARQANCQMLTTLLADTIQLSHMYKKAHWQVKGETFYQLHLLYDKHHDEQEELVDLIAERIQQLGGVAQGMPSEVVQNTKIENPPSDVMTVPEMISRLLEAHTHIAEACNTGIDQTEDNKDWGTNDMLMSEILRTNQLQYWFVSQHVIDTPLVHTDGPAKD